jgi:hypothetical protein
LLRKSWLLRKILIGRL